jgi:hypothetical protein
MRRASSFQLSVENTPMRTVLAFCLILLLATPGFARPGSIEDAAADRNAANWADRLAQARVMDGDYDGAVQAQIQADSDRHEAARQTMLARSSRR